MRLATLKPIDNDQIIRISDFRQMAGCSEAISLDLTTLCATLEHMREGGRYFAWIKVVSCLLQFVIVVSCFLETFIPAQSTKHKREDDDTRYYSMREAEDNLLSLDPQ